MAVGDVRVEDLWFEIPLDRNWIAAYRLQVTDTATTFSELRVIPNEGTRANPGEWRAEFHGMSAETKAPLTAKVISKIQLNKHRTVLASIIRNVERQGAASAFGNPSMPRRTATQAGAYGRPPQFYAQFALRYDAVEYGDERRQLKVRSTKRILAGEYGVPVSTITSWLRTCRSYGFLETTREGKRGGAATQLARDVAGESPGVLLKKEKGGREVC
jgi:hypothetical protein